MSGGAMTLFSLIKLLNHYYYDYYNNHMIIIVAVVVVHVMVLALVALFHSIHFYM